MTLSRGEFLKCLGGAAVGLQAACKSPSEQHPRPQPGVSVVDFHVHLFGVGTGGTGCRVSEEAREHWNYWFLRKLLGLREQHLDQDFVSVLVRQLRGSFTDKAVLLAHDGRYDSAGRFDKGATGIYVPNDYLFYVVSENPDLFIPCVSINPKRRDAFEELDRCAEAGARVLKIHPPIQDVDPAEERFRPFYRRIAGHGILLMVHTGMEPAPGVVGHEFSDPARLAPALEEGCTVVAAHAGTGGFFDPKDDYQHFLPNLVHLMHRFPNLYCDASYTASMFYWRELPRLLEESIVFQRIIYASDWPFPSNAFMFWNRLGMSRLLALCSETNLFERDYRLKQALGLPVAALERGVKLLRSA